MARRTSGSPRLLAGGAGARISRGCAICPAPRPAPGPVPNPAPLAGHPGGTPERRTHGISLVGPRGPGRGFLRWPRFGPLGPGRPLPGILDVGPRGPTHSFSRFLPCSPTWTSGPTRRKSSCWSARTNPRFFARRFSWTTWTNSTCATGQSGSLALEPPPDPDASGERIEHVLTIGHAGFEVSRRNSCRRWRCLDPVEDAKRAKINYESPRR